MLTDYEGLYDVYLATGESRYLDGLSAFIKQLCEKELMIHGSLSNNEFWFDGAKNQTGVLEQSTETCATAQWMIILYDMLKLTGDSQWGDLLEKVLYNALVSAMVPEGNWWDYFAGFNDERVPSPLQHGSQALTCCVSSGPRGLLLTSLWAVMNAKDGVVVNLYGNVDSETTLQNGLKVRMKQESSYPEDGKIKITVLPDTSSDFKVLLRIPSWSKANRLTVNGEEMECVPGEYAVIKRTWEKGDQIELDLDMRARIIKAPSGAPDVAIVRGPLLLSLDNRMVKEDDFRALYIDYDKDGYVPVKRVAAPEGVWMAFEVPVYTRRGPGGPGTTEPLILFDYPSAGNLFIANNGYRTWFPQPMYLPTAFHKGIWKLKYWGSRPYIPFGKELETTAADVTAVLQYFLKNNKLEILVDNEVFCCDPAPGRSKDLSVIYSVNGKENSLTVKEGERLKLPLETESSGSIKILSARYGLSINH